MRRLGRELDAVDDVAAIARQLDAADRLGRRGARLGELAGDAADLHHRRARRRRSAPPPSAGTRGRSRGCCRRECSAKLSAQSPPCSRKASPVGDLAERLLQLARLACKNQRRKAGELRLDGLQRRRVRIGRHLLDRLVPPARRCPTLAHDSPLTPARPFAGGHRNLDLLDLGQKRALYPKMAGDASASVGCAIEATRTWR